MTWAKGLSHPELTSYRPAPPPNALKVISV
jgi:hypothetical protein